MATPSGSQTDATNPYTSTDTAPVAPLAGQQIGASTYRQMLTVLNDLVGHTHTWTDTYNTNCQCDCGRGNL
jgi:hypothetical protein